MAKRRRGGLTKKQKERLKQFALWSGVGWLTWETWNAMVLQRQRRRDAFNVALNKKSETGKPLLVLGDPEGAILGRILGADFDCADLCIDSRGCANCENVIVADPETALADLGSNSHVVYVNTGIFEHTANPDQFISELLRVSGGDYVMAPHNTWSLSAWLPPAKRRVLEYPPKSDQVRWKGWSGEAGSRALAGVGSPRLRLIMGARR